MKEQPKYEAASKVRTSLGAASTEPVPLVNNFRTTAATLHTRARATDSLAVPDSGTSVTSMGIFLAACGALRGGEAMHEYQIESLLERLESARRDVLPILTMNLR
jgi:hypothetical protein